MQSLDKIDWEILDSTADDCENLEQIYRQVCYEVIATPEEPGKGFYDYRLAKPAMLLSEIAERIRALVQKGLFAIVMDENGNPWNDPEDLSYVWKGWFSMTPKGRKLWEASEHLVEQ
jgi:hypothetical protein